ncbi:extracellular matrix-binding ebh [Babesia caballi]|uniref:Extracellular matrix-binding ebh n=1 Tax=Babesia caballi TaxID=5871 RepID=A0AAV4LYW1_BABCB|nr:extracellular matrix-binding ebh [Babesia caballi]
MVVTGQKSLTEPPTNLKEAIDWVIQIKIKNNTDDLAKALQELLKEDGSEVAMKVLHKYRLVSESVIKGLEDQKAKSYFTYTALNNLSQGLKPFVTGSQANINSAGVDNVGEWVLKVKGNAVSTLITSLTTGLGNFKKAILQDSNTSSYQSATAWNSLTDSEKRDCAAILLGVMPVVYVGLTYLYWQCEGKGGWATKNLSQDEDLKQFLVAFGYADKDLETSKTGGTIATQLQTAFSGEFNKAYTATQPPPQNTSPSYPTFLKALQDKAPKPTPSTSSPLTSLYLLSYYYITNFLYDVQSSSPAKPSFLGHSGTAALAGGAYSLNLGGLGTFEAIDWILRVTGKDGQVPSGASRAITELSKQVQNLLQGVEESESKLSAEFTKVKQALNTDSGSSLITKLAEGLQQFVGYEGGMLSNTTPKLTGGGILPANVAKYQVCNAVLNFVIRFLEGLLGINGLESLNKEDVKTVIVKLRKCVGTGQVPRGFGTLVEGIGNKVDSIGKKVLKNTQGKLKEVFDEFKKVSDKCTGHDVSGPKVEGNELDKFLNAVDLTLHSNNSVYFKTYCEKLGELLKNDEFKNNANKDGPALSYGLLQTNITGVTAATTNLNNEIRNINNTPGKANLIPNAAVFSAVRDAATAFIAEIKEPTKYTSHYDKHKNPEADWGRVNAASPPLSSSAFTYASFAAELQKKVGENVGHLPTECPLSALYHGASCYFRCQQITNAKSASGAPKTIREMLYFLAALQFSSAYDEMEGHIDTVLNNPLNVADSTQKDRDNKLSAENMKEYLRASCSLSSAVLGTLQGGDGPKNSEPWLHELFCNSAYHSVIRRRFGKDINKSLGGKTFFTHICPTGCTTDGHSSGTHDKVPCEHNGCGKRPMKPSPLQAFLTDKLEGFSRRHPSDQSSHLATCSGYMCHVPMGFNPNDLRAAPGGNTQGSHISLALGSFCGGFNTPLRQLCEKLGCLTKRTPRTLGDLFGFMWHLNGQLFHKAEIMQSLKGALNQKANDIESAISKLKALWKMRPSLSSPETSGVVQSLEAMAPSIPFLYQLFMAEESTFLPITFFNLRQHCHRYKSGKLIHDSYSSNKCSNSPADLHSLYRNLGTKRSGGTDPYEACRNGNCGPYLYPLTHTDGATYIPVLASAYLSWLLYLSEDFEAGLRDILERFKGLECTKCKTSCHSDSTGSASCSCPSIVECSGVLPLLYFNGFSFGNAYSLKGGMQGTDPMKRKCQKFHDQLNAVLAQNENTPLFKLLTTIDDFLYLFRFYFFYNLSAFWVIYLTPQTHLITHGPTPCPPHLEHASTHH